MSHVQRTPEATVTDADVLGSLSKYPNIGATCGNRGISGGSRYGLATGFARTSAIALGGSPTSIGLGENLRTTTATGSVAGLAYGSSLFSAWVCSPVIRWRFGFRIANDAGSPDFRLFVGVAELTGSSFASFLGSDIPAVGAGGLVGFQWSAPRGDTNWMLIHRATGGAALTVVDTGVVFDPVNGVYSIEIRGTPAGPEVKLYQDRRLNIYDGASLPPYTPATLVANVPSGTVAAGPWAALEKTSVDPTAQYDIVLVECHVRLLGRA